MASKRKNKVAEMPLAEQIANVLGVAARLRGRWVVQRQKPENGEWDKALLLNPLMSDGGIQPPGPPLFGPLIFGSESEACDHMARRMAACERKRLARTKPQFVLVEEGAGKWRVAWNFDAPMPFGVTTDEPTARARLERYNGPEAFRVVRAEEDCLDSTVYPRTEEGIARYGKYPSARQVLAASPEVAALAQPSAAPVPHWVSALPPGEPVAIVLDRRGDGSGDDCIDATAGELFAAGFGELACERNDYGVQVYVETREQFARIASRLAS